MNLNIILPQQEVEKTDIGLYSGYNPALRLELISILCNCPENRTGMNGVKSHHT